MSSGRKRRDEHLPDIGQEAAPLIAPSKTARSASPSARSAPTKVVVFQCPCGTAAPGAGRGAPAAEPSHVGLGPGLIDEDQALGAQDGLLLTPSRTCRGDVGALLLSSVERLFSVSSRSRARVLCISPSLTAIAWGVRQPTPKIAERRVRAPGHLGLDGAVQGPQLGGHLASLRPGRGLIPSPGDWLAARALPPGRFVDGRLLSPVRERCHGADRRSSPT